MYCQYAPWFIVALTNQDILGIVLRILDLPVSDFGICLRYLAVDRAISNLYPSPESFRSSDTSSTKDASRFRLEAYPPLLYGLKAIQRGHAGQLKPPHQAYWAVVAYPNIDLFLFPAEYPKGDDINDNQPRASQANLRKNINKVFALCCNQPNTVNNRRQWQKG